MVVMQGNSARRYAGCHKDTTKLLERTRRSTCVGCVDRHVGHNRTGTFTEPYLRQSNDVAALRRRQAAAPFADENDNGALRFLNCDGMAVAMIVRHARRYHFTIGVCAGTQCD